MKAVVLLSSGSHPVSRRAVLPTLEAQAIALAKSLCDEVRGLHAGPDGEGVSDALGHGLNVVDCLTIEPDADPLRALADHLSQSKPDLIVAGRRGQGGQDTGLLPYALADALDLPILADVMAMTNTDDSSIIRLDQALAKGAKRRVTMRLPALITVHPHSAPPLPFAFGRMRRGTIRHRAGLSVASLPSDFEVRPHRARPKLMRQASGSPGENGGVIVNPDPEEAARIILEHLERIGVRSFKPKSP